MTPTEKLLEYAKEFNTSLTDLVLLDDRFPIWTGAGKSTQHHYGKGGLAQHTLEVFELAAQSNTYFKSNEKPCADFTELFLACVFHDAGKMWDYAPTTEQFTEWEKTPHARSIHHISRSAVVWTEASKGRIPERRFDDILHAILSHHGLREWGSPVGPHSRLAWLLHLNDSISARMYDNDTWDCVKNDG